MMTNIERMNLHKAIDYATEKHKGQFRKGTARPYIIHPLETLSIVMECHPSATLAMAAVLHDVLEDTDTTYEEIVKEFGKDVADLVKSHSETKTENGVKLPWQVRKDRAIEELKVASLDTKLLVFADSLANLRAIDADYERLGNELFCRFNETKDRIRWFYEEKYDIFCELSDDIAGVASWKEEYLFHMNNVFND